MIQGLAYLLLPSTDLSRSVNFYRDVLGLPLAWFEREQGHAAVEVSGLLLVLSTHEPARGTGGAVVALEVTDIQTACADLQQRGVLVPEGVQEHGGRWTARFTDPDANLLELNQTRYPAQVTTHSPPSCTLF